MMITNPIVMKRVQARVDARNMEAASTITLQAGHQPVVTQKVSKPTIMDYHLATPGWVRVANAAAAGLGAWLSVPEDEGSYGEEWESYGAQGW